MSSCSRSQGAGFPPIDSGHNGRGTPNRLVLRSAVGTHEQRLLELLDRTSRNDALDDVVLHHTTSDMRHIATHF